MPYWWVSEPRINVRLEDRPLSHQPALGPKVEFHASYRQRGAYPHDDGVFSLGPDWSCSFRAFLLVQTNDLGQLDIAGHSGGAGLLGYAGLNTAQFYTHGVVTPLAGETWQVNHPDGSRDVYSVNFTNTAGTRMIFLYQRIDPAGHALTFNYSQPDSTTLLLTSITDGDGETTAIGYNADPSFPNRIATVTDRYSRTCHLYYDASGVLTNITDVQGLASTFTYGSYGLSTMSTPYGTTMFEHGGQAVSDPSEMYVDYNGANRWVRIIQPDGGTNLYVFRQDGTAVVASDWSPVPTLASGLPNTFDNVDQSRGNSYYWGPRQYVALSTETVDSLSTNDYKLARQRHWLVDGPASGHLLEPVAIQALAAERAPSPDGTADGQVTWYDYIGKAAVTNSGATAFPRCVAVVLPNGETRFDYTERNLPGHVTNRIQSYSLPSGVVACRTNTYFYAANAIDLTLQRGVSGEQVVSNWFNNAYHQPDASYNALNEETKFTYNADRQLTSVKRPSGLTTTNVYFTSGTYEYWLDKTIDLEISRTNAYTYANGLVQTHTDERGLTTTSYWDALQRLTGTSYPDGSSTSNRYTYLDLTAAKDRLGNWTTYGYNQIRRRTAETNANGVITIYSYCPCGSLDSVTAGYATAQQETTSYEYDLQGRLTNSILADGTSVAKYYDALGQLAGTDDGTGARAYYYNNNQGMVTNISTWHGDLQNTVYDIEDRPIWVTDANGVTTTNAYDDLSRLVRRSWYGGAETNNYRLNTSGPTNFVNALGKTNWFVYDAAGRKTFETNANNEVISYTYNSAGDLLTLKDGKSQTTTWQYDLYGRATNKLDQTSVSILTYTFDANSRLATRWSKEKGTTSYGYDAVGNLTNINYPASTDIALKYDPLNRLTNMVDAVGTTAFSWSAGGQLFTEDGPWASDTVTNSYTKRLRTGLGLLQPSGYWTNGYRYDLAQRLTNLASIAGAFTYAYEPGASPLVRKLTLPNTSYVTNTFDAVGRQLSTTLKNSSHTPLNAHSYTYNAGHQRTQQTFNAGSTYTYSYDPIGQLKVADSATASEDRGYAYDAAWNLSYRTNNTTLQTFTVNGKNELTSAPSPYGGMSHDDNGNLILSHNEGRFYEYDDENQLVAVQRTAGLHTYKTTFAYDGKLRLRLLREYRWEASGGEEESLIQENGAGPLADPPGEGSWVLLSETRYVYDGMLVIQERDANNTPTVTYTRGNDLSGSREGAGGIGGLLARTHGYSAGSWSTHNYYHADGNGNVTYLVDNSQAQAASYRYDPFGNTISSSGSLASANTYRFSSKMIHATLGLYYYGYRWYAPDVQRWVNRDPIGERGDQNLFRAFRNEPLAEHDPLGLDIGKPGPYGPTPGPKQIDNKPWDGSTRKNNCYNFALDKCETEYREYLQPGQLIRGMRMPVPSAWSCEELKKRVRHDGAIDPDKSGNCPEGWHKIRLWANKGDDFHFYRQNGNNTWTHKRGENPYDSCPDPNSYNNYDNCGDLCVVNR